MTNKFTVLPVSLFYFITFCKIYRVPRESTIKKIKRFSLHLFCGLKTPDQANAISRPG